MSAGRIIIAGGNGFLGQLLAAPLCDAGYDVDLLVRHARRGLVGTQQLWDGASLGSWAARVDGARAVINLTGRSVNCRYTPRNRAEIIASRVNSVRAVGEALRAASQPPPVWVQASSLAIYGDAGDEACDEQHESGVGFSPDVVRRWEAALAAQQMPSTRQVVLRMGLVLHPSGGALRTFSRLVRFGLGGRVGSGAQWVSWLHADDFIAIVMDVIGRDEKSGVYNATAPEPAMNAELMRELRRVLRRPWSPPAPAWAVHLGAYAMRTEPELAFVSRRCVPARLLSEAFQFRFPALGPALHDLFRADPSSSATLRGVP